MFANTWIIRYYAVVQLEGSQHCPWGEKRRKYGLPSTVFPVIVYRKFWRKPTQRQVANLADELEMHYQDLVDSFNRSAVHPFVPRGFKLAIMTPLEYRVARGTDEFSFRWPADTLHCIMPRYDEAATG